MKRIVFLMALLLAFGQAEASMEMRDGRKVVATAGTAERLAGGTGAATAFTKVDICALEGNTAEVVIGGSTVVASEATRRGIPLYVTAGVPDCYTIEAKAGKTGDLSNVWVDVKVNGEGVSFFYIMEQG